MIRLTCDRCGVDQPSADMLYCVNCGVELDTPTRVVPAAAITTTPQTKRHVGRWVVNILILLLLLVIAGLVYTLWRSGAMVRNTNPEPTQTASNAPVFSQQPQPQPKAQRQAPRPTATPQDTPAPRPPQYDGNTYARQQPQPQAPPNAIAFCGDGTYGFDVSTGTCNAHGGAVRWYVSGIHDGEQPRAICGDGHISYWTHDRFATCLTGGGVRHWYYQ